MMDLQDGNSVQIMKVNFLLMEIIYIYVNTQMGQLRVYNKITGLPSIEHPRVNDGSAGWQFSTDIGVSSLLMEIIYIY